MKSPQILFSKVMHKRFFPKVNLFHYSLFYVSVPLKTLQKKETNFLFGFNRFGLLSLHSKNYGPKEEKNVSDWIQNILKQNKLDTIADGEVVLITLPKVLGYSFNPVSFYLCLDRQDRLRAVLCEVNNTFGECHYYLCSHKDGRTIQSDDDLYSRKLFHVSPFLERRGHYKFRFKISENSFGAWIDYFDEKDQKQLVTSLLGRAREFSRANILRAFLQYPLMTFKVIMMIHWQAVKLFVKRIKYVPKPEPLQNDTENLTEQNILNLKNENTAEVKNVQQNNS